MHWLKLLEKLRKEQQEKYERPQLEIPLPPIEYYRAPPVQTTPEVSERGVVIIDMYEEN